ncbi:hypothetical protein STRIP9103_09397 [Streptomyces ipomoeae 91-03]|uniref:Uncharacterized protein n=1 Tax=Streptomyces ipomoeae 91-03 TaxID=698759 RepID=L1L7M1_9ACTN|nr:hypothetical protein STRIP9103_09397 [Streptomyces ipomoeae 91-03]
MLRQAFGVLSGAGAAPPEMPEAPDVSGASGLGSLARHLSSLASWAQDDSVRAEAEDV